MVAASPLPDDSPSPIPDPRTQALATFIGRVERKHGAGTVMRLGEPTSAAVEVIPSGVLALDLATGIGGIPRGRITEIFGEESCGKTTIAALLAAQVQRDGGAALIVDTEHVLDLAWCRRLGVDTERLLVAQPSDAEEALDVVEQAVASGALDLVVLDSVAALAPVAEQQADVGEDVVAPGARLLNRSLRRMARSLHETHTALVALNQLRMLITPQPGATYAPSGGATHAKTTTPGGMGLKFGATLRIELTRTHAIREGSAITGNRVRARVVKNKLAPPLQACTIDLYYDRGPCAASSVVDMGMKAGVISNDGKTLRFGQVALGRGRVSARDRLRTDPGLCARIASAVQTAWRSDASAGAKSHTRPQAGIDVETTVATPSTVVQLCIPGAPVETSLQ
jgi:recombination protein RecA